MALQKSIVSERTGVTLEYHEVMQVSLSQGSASLIVASYVNKAAKDAGRAFSEVFPITVPYADEVLAKGVFAWAQDQVKATEKFAGATEV